MLNKDIRNNAMIIKTIIELGFEQHNAIKLTLYTKEKSNYYEIYFTVIDNKEDVFIKKFTPNIIDEESKWSLDSRHMGYENVIDLINKDFKIEFRKLKLKKLLNV